MSKDTGRSTPLRLSLSPDSGRTKRGAETRRRFSEVVVKSRVGADKERCGDSAQIQPLGKEILEEVLDSLDGDLGLVEIQR